LLHWSFEKERRRKAHLFVIHESSLENQVLGFSSPIELVVVDIEHCQLELEIVRVFDIVGRIGVDRERSDGCDGGERRRWRNGWWCVCRC
jgi:hypothetical protein